MRDFNFVSSARTNALGRQNFLCACCGESLANQLDYRHHVLPNQIGDVNDPQDAFMRTADNCVMLCDGCHHRVHENGHWRNGAIAPPEYFKYSHGSYAQEHQAWVSVLNDHWNRKFSTGGPASDKWKIVRKASASAEQILDVLGAIFVIACGIGIVALMVALLPWYIIGLIAATIIAFATCVFVILRIVQGIGTWWENRPKTKPAPEPDEVINETKDDEAGEVNLGFLFFILGLPFLTVFWLLKNISLCCYYLLIYPIVFYLKYREEQRELFRQKVEAIEKDIRKRWHKDKNSIWHECVFGNGVFSDGRIRQALFKVVCDELNDKDPIEVNLDWVFANASAQRRCENGQAASNSNSYSSSTSSAPFVALESTPTCSSPTVTFHSHADNSVPSYQAFQVDNSHTDQTRLNGFGAQQEAQNRMSTQIRQGN